MERSVNFNSGNIFSGCVMSFVIFFALPGYSQHPVSIALRAGISFATTDVYESNVKAGFGWEVRTSYRVIPHVAVYAGWGSDSFSASKSFAGDDVRFNASGYSAGFQFFHAFGRDQALNYFVRGGLIIKRISIATSYGTDVAKSSRGGGFQVEAGLCLPLGERWHLIPGIEYQTLSRDIAVAGLNYPVDLNFLSAGATLSWAL